MSKKRVVVMLDVAAWVMVEDKFLKIGYINRGSDSFKIDQHEFLFVGNSIDSINRITDFLKVDQPENKPGV